MILDTRAVSPADRSEYWAAGMAEHYFPMHVESFGSPSFDARMTGGDVGPLVVRSISGLPHRVARTAGMIAAADPESILFFFLRRGACLIEQDGRVCELRSGDVAVQDTSRPSSFEARVGFEVMVLSFPRWFLGGQAGVIARNSAIGVRGSEDPVLRLAAPLFESVGRAAASSLAETDGEVIAEMMLPVIRNLFRNREACAADDLRIRMRQYALEHLRDPALDPDGIARAHHVSTRYVHKLFASDGGVSTWIREQRLEAAADELCGTGYPVSEIASRWGYQDAASFARAFRRAWGTSPRQMRSAS